MTRVSIWSETSDVELLGPRGWERLGQVSGLGWLYIQCFQSGLHNPQKVVYMDPYLRDILGFAPSPLKLL